MKLLKCGNASGEVRAVVYVLDEPGFTEKVAASLEREDTALVSVEVGDWDRDLTPWPAKRAFGKGEDYPGLAGEYLKELLASMESFEKEAGLSPSERYLAGYSLGGLFAVYGALNSSVFTGFASVSGSVWYNDFTEYVRKKKLPEGLKKAYFSVGDREKKTKNERMQTVETCNEILTADLRERGLQTIYELNPGNHFTDPEGRMQKGLQWLLQ